MSFVYTARPSRDLFHPADHSSKTAESQVKVMGGRTRPGGRRRMGQLARCVCRVRPNFSAAISWRGDLTGRASEREEKRQWERERRSLERDKINTLIVHVVQYGTLRSAASATRKYSRELLIHVRGSSRRALQSRDESALLLFFF